jgi:hypothetical protein
MPKELQIQIFKSTLNNKGLQHFNNDGLERVSVVNYNGEGTTIFGKTN